MPKTSGVYEIQCKPTQKSYIGKAANCDRRIQEHLNLLGLDKHINAALQADYIKYGPQAFTASVLFASSDRRAISQRERIEILNREKTSLYNEVLPTDGTGKVQVAAYLPKQFLDELLIEADEHGWSLSHAIYCIIEQHIVRRKGGQGAVEKERPTKYRMHDNKSNE